MKVIYVNNQIQLGGAETVVQQLRLGLKSLGHKSPFYVSHGKSYPRGEAIIPFYPRILSRLSHTRLHSIIEKLFPRSVWTDRSFRHLAKIDADIIHIHNFHGDYASIESLAFVAKKKPVVWTFHAFWGITGGCDHPKNCFRYQDACGECPQVGIWPIGKLDNTAVQLQNKLAMLSSAPLNIVAPSHHLAEKVRNSKVGKTWNVFEIPNGVDPSRFHPERKRDAEFRRSLGLKIDLPIVLVVNRNFQDTQKGHAMVQEAISMNAGTDAQIVLAGGNSQWAADQLPPRLNIIDAGYVASREHMARLFEAADIFLFASPAENFPCVILEAMSAGCCVVATPTSGVTEQIKTDKTGFLAESLSGEALGIVFRDVLAHRELWKKTGDEARDFVEKEFSEKVMVDRHIVLYRQIMSNR
jgi:glycosyltransferase involved in cell wall biosynthesis